MKYLKLLKSKIHGGVVTGANVEYEGSITIDSNLMESAGIQPYESVWVWNMERGTRLETYAIAAPSGSGTIRLNGAAALQNKKGDRVIIASFVFLTEDELKDHKPKKIFLNTNNEIIKVCNG